MANTVTDKLRKVDNLGIGCYFRVQINLKHNDLSNLTVIELKTLLQFFILYKDMLVIVRGKVLDNETIALKTGLPVEVIEFLR